MSLGGISGQNEAQIWPCHCRPTFTTPTYILLPHSPIPPTHHIPQAKLLFLYFLRSSAFAINSNVINNAINNNSINNNAINNNAINSNNNINLRLAKLTDINGIAQTNLATLPENYAATFYNNHLRTWPNLALVAEAVPDDGGNAEIIAYALGKVDHLDASTNSFHRRPQGHVTSLAVMRDYRRLGLGNELMTQVRDCGGVRGAGAQGRRGAAMTFMRRHM